MHGGLKLRLHEIRALTFPEAFLALDEDLSGKAPPPGGVDLTRPGAREAHWQRLRELTPAQRLKMARES